MMTRPRILPWLSAVFYFAANFTKIQEIIGCFEEEESAAVKIVREIMQKESLRCDLVSNKDLREIQSIAEVFKGKSNAQLIGMNIESAVCFKYAPVTSAEMRRSELVRRMWEIIKERNLLDPTNRAFVICDTQFEDIFKCKRFKAFTMMKYLKFHVSDVSPFEN
ncbi:Upstream activation factor subunit spp27 [Trichinella sp. T9]|nr:Upstream activation factor subunit spp27 [Trichinella sp. T9]KRX51821.1 Upstream activation factor subunit spp27 [Trichinella sp. T9]